MKQRAYTHKLTCWIQDEHYQMLQSMIENHPGSRINDAIRSMLEVKYKVWVKKRQSSRIQDESVVSSWNRDEYTKFDPRWVDAVEQLNNSVLLTCKRNLSKEEVATSFEFIGLNGTNLYKFIHAFVKTQHDVPIVLDNTFCLAEIEALIL